MLQAGVVVGDTAVIQEIKAATAYVITNEDCELEEISVHLLMSFLRNNPGLCLRFYRHMAMTLAEKLRDLNKAAPPPQASIKAANAQEGQDDKKDDKGKDADSKAKPSSSFDGKGKPSDSAKSEKVENLLEKFHLPVSDTVFFFVETIFRQMRVWYKRWM